jgi:hypothetical protein
MGDGSRIAANNFPIRPYVTYLNVYFRTNDANPAGAFVWGCYLLALGHRFIKAHPDSKGSEFDAGEEVIGRFVVAVATAR